MKQTSICIFSMLGGAVLGSALTFFLTPISGPELRRAVKGFLEKEADKIRCHCGDNHHQQA